MENNLKVQQQGAININLSVTTEISFSGEYLVTCKNIFNVLCNEKIHIQHGPNFIKNKRIHGQEVRKKTLQWERTGCGRGRT